MSPTEKKNTADDAPELGHFQGMSAEDVEELLQVFIEDITERTDNLSNHILKLEENPADPAFVNVIFQEYHSLKGTGGTFGFTPLSNMAHQLESILSRVRDGKDSVTGKLVDLLLDTLPLFTTLVQRIKAKKSITDLEKDLEKKIKAYESHEPAIEDDLPAKTTSSEPQSVKTDETPKQSGFVKIRSSRIDKIIELASELRPRNHIDEQHTRELKNIIQRVKDNNELLTARFVDIISSVDELKQEQIRSALANNAESEQRLDNLYRELINVSENFSHMTASLQFEVLKTRMVPVDSLFKQIKRAARDIVKASDKKVILKFFGGETEVDKLIMDMVQDPVMHIIRNAVDHGVETPEARIESGKKREATVTISSYQLGDQIVIEIEDDGQGLDLDRIRQIAVEKGLYSDEEIASMAKKDLVNIIFHPGFSTKKEVSKVSGRGVGMDVVKSNLEKIQGVITVDTMFGKFTRITLEIPLTLASVKAVLVRVGLFYFYVQSIAVERVMRIGPKHPRPPGAIHEVLIDQSLIPYAYLGDFLSVPNAHAVDGDGTYIVVIRSGEKKMALEVDECVELQDVVLKPKADLLKNFDMVAGMSVRPDGKVAYVLEPAELFSRYNDLSRPEGKKTAWSLEFIEGYSPAFVGSTDENINIDMQEESKLLVLHCVKNETHYGIPVDNIEQVCNLTDKKLANKLEKTYRAILHLNENTAIIKKRDDLRSPLNLIEQTGTKSAVILRSKNVNSLLLIDDLLQIMLINPGKFSPIMKSGDFINYIPDILELKTDIIEKGS